MFFTGRYRRQQREELGFARYELRFKYNQALLLKNSYRDAIKRYNRAKADGSRTILYNLKLRLTVLNNMLNVYKESTKMAAVKVRELQAEVSSMYNIEWVSGFGSGSEDSEFDDYYNDVDSDSGGSGNGDADTDRGEDSSESESDLSGSEDDVSGNEDEVDLSGNGEDLSGNESDLSGNESDLSGSGEDLENPWDITGDGEDSDDYDDSMEEVEIDSGNRNSNTGSGNVNSESDEDL